jgi:hypothetical protein
VVNCLAAAVVQADQWPSGGHPCFTDAPAKPGLTVARSKLVAVFHSHAFTSVQAATARYLGSDRRRNHDYKQKWEYTFYRHHNCEVAQDPCLLSWKWRRPSQFVDLCLVDSERETATKSPSLLPIPRTSCPNPPDRIHHSQKPCFSFNNPPLGT